jgi:hypothetical protein
MSQGLDCVGMPGAGTASGAPSSMSWFYEAWQDNHLIGASTL